MSARRLSSTAHSDVDPDVIRRAFEADYVMPLAGVPVTQPVVAEPSGSTETLHQTNPEPRFTIEEIREVFELMRPLVALNRQPVFHHIEKRHRGRKFLGAFALSVLLVGGGLGFLAYKGKRADRPAVEEGTAQLVDYDPLTGIFVARETPKVEFKFVGAKEPNPPQAAQIIFEIELTDQFGSELSLRDFTTRVVDEEPEQTTCEIAKMVYDNMLNRASIRKGVEISLVESSDGVMQEVFNFSVGREGC